MTQEAHDYYDLEIIPYQELLGNYDWLRCCPL